jgi:hypothetical protein
MSTSYVHLTVRALPGTLLFHDWTEALELWRRLRAAFPDTKAMCLMPNHPHVVAEADGARRRLSGVMSGYARWRGAKRGQDAHCWAIQPPAQPLPDLQHLRRTIRYVLLNPCRARLVDDPLAWPLSTHRDHVGLGDPALAVRDPAGFHAWVSGDPSVSVTGTRLPELELGAPLRALEDAVGAVLRLTPAEVRGSARGRALALRAAVVSEHTDATALATWLGISESLVYRRVKSLPPRRSLSREPLLAAVLRVAGDPRFGPLVLPPRAMPTRPEGWRLRPVENTGA